MKNLLNVTVAVAGSIIVAGVATAACIKTIRDEKAKRAEIKEDQTLDVKAINIATERVMISIQTGEIQTMNEFVEALRDEIAFQKIAVRH